MGVTCKILKTYTSIDKTEYGETRLCEVSWNNRPCAGVDIRKYDKEKDQLFKGITVSYDGMTDIVKSCIENGLVNLEVVEEAVKARRDKEFDDDDYANLFDKMNKSNEKYTRDKYGYLIDDEKHIVILSRRR